MQYIEVGAGLGRIVGIDVGGEDGVTVRFGLEDLVIRDAGVADANLVGLQDDRAEGEPIAVSTPNQTIPLLLVGVLPKDEVLEGEIHLV